MGRSDEFDDALVAFAMSYADQTKRDHGHLLAALADARLPKPPAQADKVKRRSMVVA
ncbi:hypothetical protein GCM10007874_40480 [Labrys miyagiensis]|uniref:Uncharacterized protein n=2 Tax=Labrys miyagiensis TaxID=346912 RepID=A0ABQ6CL64_9HYPH|nr:hypothetical protein GCM10007874_40480 [Labrys miyagiensis]